MGVRILQPLQTNLESIQLPLLSQPFLLLRLAVRAGLVAERVAHFDEGEAVVPCSSFAAAEGGLGEEGAEERDFAGVVVLRRKS